MLLLTRYIAIATGDENHTGDVCDNEIAAVRSALSYHDSDLDGVLVIEIKSCDPNPLIDTWGYGPESAEEFLPGRA